MQRISNFVTSLLTRINDVREESGQTLVEYGLIVALLSIAAIGVLSLVGQDIIAVFDTVGSALSNASGGT